MNIELPFKIPPVTKRDGDYYGEDGRLFCGTCNEPREAFFSVPGNESVVIKRPAMCACARAKQAAAEEEKRLHDHIGRVDLLRKRCFLDGAAKTARLEDAVVPERIASICRGIAGHWEAAAKNGTGMIFWGGVGTGKSFMAAAVANTLIEQEHSVEMRNMSYYLNCSYDEHMSRIESVSMPELLILDDLGIERDTGFGMETVFSVVDRRYRSGRPMIITTNISLGFMLQTSDIRYQRIFDRILEVCVPVEFSGDSLRKRNRKNNIDDFQKMLREERQTI